MGRLTVSVSATESSVLVSVAGDADLTVSTQLGESLAAELAGARYLVVDVSRLSFIDVACVRVLVGVCEAAKDAGGTLALVAPQPIVGRMLELCRADQLIAVYGSGPDGKRLTAECRGGSVLSCQPASPEGGEAAQRFDRAALPE